MWRRLLRRDLLCHLRGASNAFQLANCRVRKSERQNAGATIHIVGYRQQLRSHDRHCNWVEWIRADTRMGKDISSRQG